MRRPEELRSPPGDMVFHVHIAGAPVATLTFEPLFRFKRLQVLSLAVKVLDAREAQRINVVPRDLARVSAPALDGNALDPVTGTERALCTVQITPLVVLYVLGRRSSNANSLPTNGPERLRAAIFFTRRSAGRYSH